MTDLSAKAVLFLNYIKAPRLPLLPMTTYEGVFIHIMYCKLQQAYQNSKPLQYASPSSSL